MFPGDSFVPELNDISGVKFGTRELVEAMAGAPNKLVVYVWKADPGLGPDVRAPSTPGKFNSAEVTTGFPLDEGTTLVDSSEVF